MKKQGLFFVFIFFVSIICACGEKAEIFVTVSEVYNNAFMAVCNDDGGSFSKGDKVYVSCETMPELQPGDEVSVTFNGEVMQSDPAQIVAIKIEFDE